jgi:adenine-specific DNA-methyltransferase
MQKLTAADPETKSPDLAAANIAALRALFPELLTEGQDGVAVNLDVLKQLVGDKTVTDAEEKYGLNWHGKRRARQLALTPSTGTLRPCPADSVDWDTTQNLMIEGDNLEVLKLLQKSYAGKVKLIYIDPPYNTGKDFVYPDNFRDNIGNYLELTGQTGEGGKKLSSNTEASGRFHTDWLNMMYPRLKLARNLLREDGALFVSIDDHELCHLKRICDEVFGEESYKGTIVRTTGQTTGQDSGGLGSSFDYVLVYLKDNDSELSGLALDENDLERYQEEDARGKYALWQLRKTGSGDRREDRPNMFFPVKSPDGTEVFPMGPTGYESRWRFDQKGYDRLVAEDFISWKKRPRGNAEEWWPYVKTYLEGRTKRPSPLWDDLPGSKKASIDLRELLGGSVFSNPKPIDLVKRVLRILPESANNYLVLDFFGGSGTTAQSVLELNAEDGGSRRFGLVQLPEPLELDDKDQKAAAAFCDKISKPRTIAELTKERLRRAGKKIREENPLFAGDLGFRVFKLASSNIRAWEPDRDKLAETLEASIEHLKTDRTEQDILFELLLKLGLDLCVRIETRIFYHEKHEAHEKGGDQKVEAMMSLHPQDFRAFRVFRGSPAESPEGSHTVHSIGGGSLLVCLSPSIPQADVEPLALGLVAWHKELKPAGETTVVFRDSAFADDVAKTNLTAILNQHGLETVRSL